MSYEQRVMSKEERRNPVVILDSRLSVICFENGVCRG